MNSLSDLQIRQWIKADERHDLGRWKYPNIMRSRIERDIKPHIGGLVVDTVRPMHIDAMLQVIVQRGTPTIYCQRCAALGAPYFRLRYQASSGAVQPRRSTFPIQGGRRWRRNGHCYGMN